MNTTTFSFHRRELPETINIHLTRTCNFGCRFCYAEFTECSSARIPPDHHHRILEAFASAGPLANGRRRKVRVCLIAFRDSSWYQQEARKENEPMQAPAIRLGVRVRKQPVTLLL